MQPSVFSKVGCVECSLLDYLTLIGTLGQVVREHKRSYIPPCENTILERFNMSSEEWLKLSERSGGKFRYAVGSTKELASYAKHTKRAWVSGKCNMMACNL